MFTKYLAIDYGEKRVGIAVSDESKKYSFSRDYLANDDNLISALLKLILEENISKIIIGHPLNMNSGKTTQTLKTEEFKSSLENVLQKNHPDVELILFDERFSSKIAEAGILNSGLKMKKRRDKGLVDSLSAQIILQDYIDKLKNLSVK